MTSSGWIHLIILLLLAACVIIFVLRSKLFGGKADPAGNEFYSNGQQDLGHSGHDIGGHSDGGGGH